MPVDTKHPEYLKREKQWIKCHDVIEGADAVKSKKTDYLPSLASQSDAQYNAYVLRAPFFAATARTVQGLVGAIFRKQAHAVYPEPYKQHIDYLTTDGLNLEDFSQEVTHEIMTAGRLGLLVDVSVEEGVDDRAYVATYIAENIINWETKKKGNVEILSKVVLKEKYLKNPKDEFSHESETQYRVLRLALNKQKTSDVYSQEIWRKLDDKDEFKMVPDSLKIPTRAGVALDHIPFHFLNAENLTPSTEKPPLLDMVELNLSHYRSSADIEHGAHFTALPTPWVAGFPATTKLSIGSGIAWVTEEVNAKAGMLEYTGQGLNAIEKRIEVKEKQMAILGARMLEAQKAGVESEGAMKLRGAGEGGALAMTAKTISSGITKVLKQVAWWSKVADAEVAKIEYQLNSDYTSAKLSPQELTALMQAWQGGGMSQDSFLYNLKTGEMLPNDRTIEQEKDLIEAETGGLGNDADVGSTPVKRNFKVVNDKTTGKPVGIQEE